VWANFRKYYITEYEKLLAEGGRTTLGQEGYGGAFHMADTLEDESSLTESIVKYAERATAAERKIPNLEQCLAQLEVNSQMGATPPNMAYYAPEAAYYQLPAARKMIFLKSFLEKWRLFCHRLFFKTLDPFLEFSFRERAPFFETEEVYMCKTHRGQVYMPTTPNSYC